MVRLRLWLGGLATAGMVAGHELGYLLATPEPVHRRVLLERTGHAHWGAVGALALGLLVANLYYAALKRLRTEDGTLGDDRAIFRHSLSRLVLLQPAAFILLELLERLFAGHPVAHFLSEPAVLAGLLSQVVFALAGALLLVLFLRIVVAVARLIARGLSGSTLRLPALDGTHAAFVQILALRRRAPRAPPGLLLIS